MEFAALENPHLGHFLSQMEGGVKRLGLLQEPVDQFLGAANGQRRDVVDRLIRIQLGALAARLRQGVDDMGADAEKAQFEDLKQSDGTCADDDRFDLCGGGLRRTGVFRHVA